MGPRGGRVVSDQAFLQKHDRFEYCCPHAADHNNQTGVKRHRLWWVFLEVCSNVKTAETVSVGTSSCCAALVMIFWVVFFSGLKSKIRYSGFSYSPKTYCTRPTGPSNFTIGMNVCVNGGLSLLYTWPCERLALSPSPMTSGLASSSSLPLPLLSDSENNEWMKLMLH